MKKFHQILTSSSAVGVLAIATLLSANAAHAQADTAAAVAAPQDDADAGEIVVTAQKRSERLQDVPLAVTAVTGEGLADRQINDTTALVKAVPSLTFQQGAHPANTTFRIRGVGTALFGQGVESSVAVVVDGVPLVRQAQALSDLADIERIEVLRGPQGTLFGKNASAGLINIVTARPTSTLQGNGDVTIAERGEYRVKGTVSGPLSDTLRARISGFYNDVEGPAYNVTRKERVNGQSGWGVTQGPDGLLAMTVPQVVSVRGGTLRPHYDPTGGADGPIAGVLGGLLAWCHAGSWWARWRGFGRMVRGAWRMK